MTSTTGFLPVHRVAQRRTASRTASRIFPSSPPGLNALVAASVAFQRGLAEEEDVASRQAIVDEGCEIADLSAQELSVFSEAVQPLWADAQKTYGKEMFGMMPGA